MAALSRWRRAIVARTTNQGREGHGGDLPLRGHERVGVHEWMLLEDSLGSLAGLP